MEIRVAVNERGRVVGEGHKGAKLTDAEVDLLLELHEDGHGYDWLAAKFGVSKSCVRWICVGRNRCQTPARWVTVSVAD